MKGHEFIRAIENAKTEQEIERLCKTQAAETEMMIREAERTKPLPEVGAVYHNSNYRATVTGHTPEGWIRFDREEIGDIGRYRYHKPEAMIARLPVFLAVYAKGEPPDDDPPAWAMGQDPDRCERCGGLLNSTARDYVFCPACADEDGEGAQY